ncbi:hypothetical protein DFJ43DRAFT_1150140 [Lentinula guzmanii]|uniref:Retrotransposon gag domain-containing protein n=1 Tax=Lentinula guzmanii TaxID=2804957 RepID=A0AA38JJJ0_9AGAR|nr:hypothetical protein DFJ43DRAFT_1150140 [Lentinula guzmanii]
MASHGYNTRGNQQGASELNQPGVSPNNSPRLSGEYEGEPNQLDSPLTSIVSDRGPSSHSAPAGPEIETAPAGPEIIASAGPEPTSPKRTSATEPAGGRNNASRYNSPEHYNLASPPPVVKTPTPWDNREKSLNERGKGPDARNWGNAGLNELETDPDVQAQILNSFEAVNADTRVKDHMLNYFDQWRASETERIQREVQNFMTSRIQELENLVQSAHIATKPTDTEREVSESDSEEVVAKSKSQATWRKRREATLKHPSDLIAPKSHVAHIFSALRERNNHDPVSSPEPSDDSSEDETVNDRHMDHKKKKKSKMYIKPMKPTEIYEGNPNLRSLHRNMRETIAYCDDGNVPTHQEVEVALRFLKGKAYTFFERTCGKNPGNWTLSTFYEKLYDFVFPIDFRTEQRRRLITLQQKGKRVRDHVGIFQDTKKKCKRRTSDDTHVQAK